MSKERHTTVDCVEHIYKLQDRNDELRDALVTVIRSLDEHHFEEVQSTGNSLGIIRQIVDQALNYPRYGDV
tara:strand:- start:8428 stop:8640 length:213 start_codon:yes stop_codon:yes gene_type:complete